MKNRNGIAWEEKKCHICRCQRRGCGHVWFSEMETPPKTCPKCRSPNWNKQDWELGKAGRPKKIKPEEV